MTVSVSVRTQLSVYTRCQDPDNTEEEASLVMEGVGLQHGIHGTAEIRSGRREDLFSAEVSIIHRDCKVHSADESACYR